MTSKKRLFEPRDLSSDEVANASARTALARFPAEWMPWLIDGLRALRPFEFPWASDRDEWLDSGPPTPRPVPPSTAPSDERLAATATLLANEATQTAANSLARFIAKAWTAYRHDGDGDAFEPGLRSLVEGARGCGVDFPTVVHDLAARQAAGKGTQHPIRPTPIEVARALSALGALSPTVAVSMERLVSLAGEVGAYPKQWGSALERPLEAEPSSLYFWLRVDVGVALRAAVELASRVDDDVIARVTKGVLWEVGCWGWFTKHHSESYAPKGRPLQAGAERVFCLLVERSRGNTGLLRDPLFIECLFRLAFIAFDAREPEMTPQHRGLLLQLAKPELARLRVLLSSSTAQDAPALLERESDHIRAVAHALFSLSTLWEGMKPLLLLVRAAPIPIFAADLSWWTVKAPMTNGVGSLANAMMFYFQSYARFEQNSDEELKDLRASLAAFCLERLKTDKQRQAPKEPNPIWRTAAIRAVGELGINPEGKGHRVLHHAMEHDVDDDVRAAAAAVYPRLREGRGLPAKMSPRVAVLHALWWLRQAQLVALGVTVDEDGAQRTRAEEVRYTTFKKETPNPS